MGVGVCAGGGWGWVRGGHFVFRVRDMFILVLQLNSFLSILLLQEPRVSGPDIEETLEVLDRAKRDANITQIKDALQMILEDDPDIRDMLSGPQVGEAANQCAQILNYTEVRARMICGFMSCISLGIVNNNNYIDRYSLQISPCVLPSSTSTMVVSHGPIRLLDR